MSAEGQGAASGAASGAATGTAILPGWGTAIGGVLGGLAGAAGGLGVDQANTNKKNAIEQYMSQLQALDMPRYEDLKLSLQRYATGQQLTPAQLTALQDIDSEVTKIAQDKAAKQSQLEALAGLKERARGGLTLQDKADLLEAQSQIDRQQSGAQKAILQNMAARGQSGSGAELAARLQATQQGATTAAQNSLNIAGQSRNQAIQALKDSASMGRQIGQDQLNFDTMKAKSADETRRSNLERLQNSMQYNVGNQNQANQYNTNRANSIADQNTSMANQEQQANKNILWNDYAHQVGRLKGIANLNNEKADLGVKNAQNEAAGIGGILSSAGGLAGGLKNAFGSNKSVNPVKTTDEDEINPETGQPKWF